MKLPYLRSPEVVVSPEHRALEAARLTGTGLNTQHWRFIFIENKENIARLARNSSSGKWVAGANFAVIVLTNPEYKFHMIDVGRVVQDMQLAAWNYGVVSCVFTGVFEGQLRNDFGIPPGLYPAIVVGFGYPAYKLTGKKKNRVPPGETCLLRVVRTAKELTVAGLP